MQLTLWYFAAPGAESDAGKIAKPRRGFTIASIMRGLFQLLVWQYAFSEITLEKEKPCLVFSTSVQSRHLAAVLP